ncbi:dihydrodipicolinate synthase family protein [Terriglobus tenax]|uniref:dihydrodipicolinate synthase family protein n=1 Tax=Terriglobus tenax TaxID=1111115 RepID=UPI0021DFC112|nr:dihydrodipicolinate synthase family protein [Terriglobus tenax]
MAKLVMGVYAAVLTPRDAAGRIDTGQLRGWLEFLIGKGIQGFAINGATGEFPQVTETEFVDLMETVAEATVGRAKFLAGIGAASSMDAIRLGKIAGRAGAQGLLLPMPYFFPYSQGDLAAFSSEVAHAVQTPVLLYNLPQFTSGLEPEATLSLIEHCPNIIGIKDSSGSLDTVSLLTKRAPAACRIIGNDNALAPALKAGVADGVVSGVSCVLPELIKAIFEAGQSEAKAARLDELNGRLRLFIQQLDRMPTPWGLKVFGESRKLARANFPFALSDDRVQQMHEMMAWFTENHAAMMAV